MNGQPADVTLAIVAVLKADATLAALVGTNVYDNELPTDSSASGLQASMPVKAITVEKAGGPPSPATLQIATRRYTIKSYGETMHLSEVVDTAVYNALKQIGPGVWANTYIHWAKQALPGHALRDPGTQWPFTVSSWLVEASDL